MVKHLDGYIGFCKLHLGMEPTLDLVMEPSCFAKYIAFLEVSCNNGCSGSYKVAIELTSWFCECV